MPLLLPCSHISTELVPQDGKSSGPDREGPWSSVNRNPVRVRTTATKKYGLSVSNHEIEPADHKQAMQK